MTQRHTIRKSLSFIFGMSYAIAALAATVGEVHAQESTRFAVIGDYGEAGRPEADVAALVRGWNPDIVITTGDNNYSSGAASTIDANVGQYYHEFIHPYAGSYGGGAGTNRFFPSLGNHDWVTAGAVPYLNYFTLPGNERYYDFVWGPVHFFALDSDSHEPDGISSTSVQAAWLKDGLAASTSRWKIVYLHHAPYSSAEHGSNKAMQWPYREWGATAVLAGHDHTYERIVLDQFPYFVNGIGGNSLYAFGTPVRGSKVRFNGDYGAMLVEAYSDSIVFRCFARTGVLVDAYAVLLPGTKSVGDHADGAVPLNHELCQNYPNPFNPGTTIRYELPERTHVVLTVFNMIGEKVTTLVDEVVDAGYRSVEFNAAGLASGVYFYRLQAGTFVETKRMTVVK